MRGRSDDLRVRRATFRPSVVRAGQVGREGVSAGELRLVRRSISEKRFFLVDIMTGLMCGQISLNTGLNEPNEWCCIRRPVLCPFKAGHSQSYARVPFVATLVIR